MFLTDSSRRIVRSLEKFWNRLDEDIDSENEISDGMMSVDEKMRLWRTHEKAIVDNTAPEPTTADLHELEDEPPIPELPQARAFLTAHSFYPRLIFRLKSILEDKVCEGYRSRDIRQKILKEITRPASPSILFRTAKFTAPAPSRLFLANDALYKNGRDLSDTMIVAGGLDNAFTTTCAEYVRMIWGKDGVAVLDKVQEALTSEIRISWISIGELGKETHISFELREGPKDRVSSTEHLLVTATGNPLTIADLGEELAWLASSFLELGESKSLMIRKPEVTVKTSDSLWDLTILVNSEDALALKASSSPSKPRCWHEMLQGFNLVEGFPIRPRKTTQKGLEIPFDMMAFLAETPRATVFDSRMLLKGWATSLIPTAQVDDSWLWHYMREEKGEHLSYGTIVDSCAETSQSVFRLGWSCLDQGRHFLGWCDNARVLAGKFLFSVPLSPLESWKRCTLMTGGKMTAEVLSDTRPSKVDPGELVNLAD